MPTTVVVTPPTVEPVTLALLKTVARVTGTAEDDFLTLLGSAARELVEGFTGRHFASKVVKTTFRLSEDYQLDPLAGDPTAVEGFITDLTQLPPSFVEYTKGISVSRDYPLSWAQDQTYAVTYPIVADPAAVPAAVKAAILELATEMYDNRGSSSTGTISPELPVNYKVKLQSYVIKPVLY